MTGDKTWLEATSQSSPEDVILMNAIGDLPIPDPSATELVSISALIEQDVPGSEGQRAGLVRCYPNPRYLAKVEVAALDVHYSKVGDLDETRIALSLGVLRDSSDNLGDLTERRPRPIGTSKKGEGGCPSTVQFRARPGK